MLTLTSCLTCLLIAEHIAHSADGVDGLDPEGLVDLVTEAGQIKARRRNGEYIRVGVNFPRLQQLAPLKRLRELRDFLKRI